MTLPFDLTVWGMPPLYRKTHPSLINRVGMQPDYDLPGLLAARTASCNLAPPLGRCASRVTSKGEIWREAVFSNSSVCSKAATVGPLRGTLRDRVVSLAPSLAGPTSTRGRSITTLPTVTTLGAGTRKHGQTGPRHNAVCGCSQR